MGTPRILNLQHLDAAENVFFQRELEFISTEMLNVKYVQGKTRLFLPVDNSCPPEDESFTYRMWDSFGAAKAISSPADDLPMAGVDGNETNQRFQSYGLAFGYTVDEIKASAKLGRSLDASRAEAVRKGLEQKLDNIAADGDSTYGLYGLNTLANTNTTTPSTKASGSVTPWLTGTPLEIYGDMTDMCSKVVIDSKEQEKVTRILLPTKQYEQILHTRMNATISDTTILSFFKATHPDVEVYSWERLAAVPATSGGTLDRMIGYNPTKMNIRLLMSIEFEQQAPQLKNYAYSVNCRFKTGGVISPYPKSVIFSDGI